MWATLRGYTECWLIIFSLSFSLREFYVFFYCSLLDVVTKLDADVTSVQLQVIRSCFFKGNIKFYKIIVTEFYLMNDIF